jgi:Flp pilus assembly protein TadG
VIATRRRAQRGQVLTEFGLVIPVALVLMFGTLDMGRALFAYDSVSNGARIGSRYAIVRGSTCAVAGCPATSATVQTYVRNRTPGIDPSSMTVTANWPGGNVGCTSTATPYNGPGCLVTVTASYKLTFTLLQFLGKLVYPISSTSQMVISQ